jgi:hypothetical protein
MPTSRAVFALPFSWHYRSISRIILIKERLVGLADLFFNLVELIETENLDSEVNDQSNHYEID